MLQSEDEFNQEMRDKYGSPCILDGITNIEKFYNAKYQILWILKEANDPSGNGWDMRNFHKNVQGYNKWKQTYQKIVQVSHGILNGIYDYKQIPQSDNIVNAMHDIAFINVKKVAGGASAYQPIIDSHYTDHKDFLHYQIEKINPNVIINCSRVWELFKDLSVSPINKIEPFHYSFDDKRLVINAYHPAVRKRGFKESMYFDAIAEIRKLSGR